VNKGKKEKGKRIKEKGPSLRAGGEKG